jgi:hypothetical protein
MIPAACHAMCNAAALERPAAIGHGAQAPEEARTTRQRARLLGPHPGAAKPRESQIK